MSILLSSETKVVVQGITGRAARYHIGRMLAYGTNVVGGTSTRPAIDDVHGVRVFSSTHDAMGEVGVDLVLSMVPARHVLDAGLEAIEAGAACLVILAEGVPLQDGLMVRDAAQSMGCKLVGPNTNGIATPAQATAGFFPPELSKPGRVGIVSRSGTLAYGISVELLSRDLGQSTIVGIGGDRCRGVGFADCLALFEGDSETEAVLLLGEIGGSEEQAAAEYLSKGYSKPVVAYIAGRHAPSDVTMGHAGAIIGSSSETVEAKTSSFRAANVPVARSLGEAAQLMDELLSTGAL